MLDKNISLCQYEQDAIGSFHKICFVCGMQLVSPEEYSHIYSEKIVHLPHCYFVNDYKQVLASPSATSNLLLIFQRFSSSQFFVSYRTIKCLVMFAPGLFFIVPLLHTFLRTRALYAKVVSETLHCCPCIQCFLDPFSRIILDMDGRWHGAGH